MTNIYYKEFLHVSDSTQEIVCFYCKQALIAEQARVYRILIKQSVIVAAAQDSSSNTPDSIFRKLQTFAFELNESPQLSRGSNFSTPLLNNRTIQKQNEKLGLQAPNIVIQPFHQALCFDLFQKMQKLDNLRFYKYTQRWKNVIGDESETMINDLYSKHRRLIEFCESTCLPNQHYWMPSTSRTFNQCLSFKFEGVLSQTHTIDTNLLPRSFVDHLFTKIQILRLEMPRDDISQHTYLAFCRRCLDAFSNANHVVAELYYGSTLLHLSHFNKEKQNKIQIQLVIVVRLETHIVDLLYDLMVQKKNFIFERLNYDNPNLCFAKHEMESDWFKFSFKYKFALLEALAVLFRTLTEIDVDAWLHQQYYIWNHVFNQHRCFSTLAQQMLSPKKHTKQNIKLFEQLDVNAIRFATQLPTLKQLYDGTNMRPTMICDGVPDDINWRKLRDRVRIVESMNLDPITSHQKLSRQNNCNMLVFVAMLNAQEHNVLNRYIIINNDAKKLYLFEGEYHNDIFPVLINADIETDLDLETALMHTKFNSSYESVEYLGQSKPRMEQPFNAYQTVFDVILDEQKLHIDKQRQTTHQALAININKYNESHPINETSRPPRHRSISSIPSLVEFEANHHSQFNIRKDSLSVSLSNNNVDTFTDFKECDSP